MKISTPILLIAVCAGCAGGGAGDIAEDGTDSLAADSRAAGALGADALSCRKLTLTSGKIGSGQSASSLAAKDQSGTQDSWTKYVEFSKGSNATCLFSLGSGVPASSVSALSLEVNYRGPTKAEMLWVFEALDPTAGAWVSIADNGFAADWVWSAATRPLPGVGARFINAKGEIQVRYRTSSKLDASQLDLWILRVAPGSADAGVPPAQPDAGGSADAGGGLDAGPAFDSGTGSDAGAGADAGSIADAGAGADAGPVCIPACTGKQCGSDGCGGTCGACGAGQSCSASGQCETPSGWWKPTNDMPLHFHWQLMDTFAYPSDVVAGQTVYDIDGDLNTAETVAQLHAAGFKVICYMEVGSVENYRADYQDFVNAGVVGKAMPDWPGEYWLDISTDANIAKILPLMQKRMVNWCKEKGFDAIEPDTSDVEGAPSAQVLKYNKQIAEMAHALGLGIGLKNHAGSDLAALEPYYDWSLVEQCWEYQECDSFVDTFLAKNKPVWNVEYNVAPNCAQANAWHMISMRRDLDLVGPRASGYVYQPCMADSKTTW